MGVFTVREGRAGREDILWRGYGGEKKIPLVVARAKWKGDFK